MKYFVAANNAAVVSKKTKCSLRSCWPSPVSKTAIAVILKKVEPILLVKKREMQIKNNNGLHFECKTNAQIKFNMREKKKKFVRLILSTPFRIAWAQCPSTFLSFLSNLSLGLPHNNGGIRIYHWKITVLCQICIWHVSFDNICVI